MNRGRYISPKEQRENATEFYKLVLRWQRERGHGRAARQAAIGLPAELERRMRGMRQG